MSRYTQDITMCTPSTWKFKITQNYRTKTDPEPPLVPEDAFLYQFAEFQALDLEQQ